MPTKSDHTPPGSTPTNSTTTNKNKGGGSAKIRKRTYPGTPTTSHTSITKGNSVPVGEPITDSVSTPPVHPDSDISVAVSVASSIASTPFDMESSRVAPTAHTNLLMRTVTDRNGLQRRVYVQIDDRGHRLYDPEVAIPFTATDASCAVTRFLRNVVSPPPPDGTIASVSKAAWRPTNATQDGRYYIPYSFVRGANHTNTNSLATLVARVLRECGYAIRGEISLEMNHTALRHTDRRHPRNRCIPDSSHYTFRGNTVRLHRGVNVHFTNYRCATNLDVTSNSLAYLATLATPLSRVIDDLVVETEAYNIAEIFELSDPMVPLSMREHMQYLNRYVVIARVIDDTGNHRALILGFNHLHEILATTSTGWSDFTQIRLDCTPEEIVLEAELNRADYATNLCGHIVRAYIARTSGTSGRRGR